MVTAGVFMVARLSPMFELAPVALQVVTLVGAVTAFFAATIGLVQNDIKRVVAYSTCSQLGYMFVACGVGAYAAGIFHLFTHAFFKALLFLGSGSVIHGMEATVGHDSNTSQDIRNMGNLRRFMPTTWLTYMAGYLALAGIIPFAGFWSKDEILADAFGNGHLIVWLVLTVAAFLTAFYMTRQVTVVFFGNFRGHNPRTATHPSEPKAVEHAHADPHDDAVAGEHAHGGHDPHESPWTMTLPLIILAIFATLAGLVNFPGFHWLSSFFGQEAAEFNVVTAAIALVLALAGIGLGVSLYRNAFASAEDLDPLEARFPALFRLLNKKYYFDEFYASTFGRLSYGLALAWSWLDRRVLDRFINGTGLFTLFVGEVNFIVDDTLLNDGADRLTDLALESGDGVRQIETGKIQDYVSLIFMGVVVLGIIYLYAFRQ
jgi:NADH-quinone oxidoreductase subunit L